MAGNVWKSPQKHPVLLSQTWQNHCQTYRALAATNTDGNFLPFERFCSTQKRLKKEKIQRKILLQHTWLRSLQTGEEKSRGFLQNIQFWSHKTAWRIPDSKWKHVQLWSPQTPTKGPQTPTLTQHRDASRQSNTHSKSNGKASKTKCSSELLKCLFADNSWIIILQGGIRAKSCLLAQRAVTQGHLPLSGTYESVWETRRCCFKSSQDRSGQKCAFKERIFCPRCF